MILKLISMPKHKWRIISVGYLSALVAVVFIAVSGSTQPPVLEPGKPPQCDEPADPISMPFAANLATQAGFTTDNAVIIVAIAWAESKGDPHACFKNDDGSWDRGILQINSSAHSKVPNEAAFVPSQAFVEGYKIYQQASTWREDGFNEWSTYLKGMHKDYLTAARNAISNPRQLRIRLGSNSSQWSSHIAGKQNQATFHYKGTGFTPNTILNRHFSGPNGESIDLRIRTDASGALSWKFEPSCKDAAGDWFVSVSHPNGGRSNSVTQTIIEGCAITQPPSSNVWPTSIRSNLQANKNHIRPSVAFDISDLTEFGCGDVWAWDESREDWTQNFFVDTFQSVWIWVEKSCTVTFDDPARRDSFNLDVASGWWQLTSTKSWNEIKGSCVLEDGPYVYDDTVSGNWREISKTTPMDGFKAYWVAIEKPCRTTRATGLTNLSSQSLAVSPQQPGEGPPGQPPPSEPPTDTPTLTINGQKSASVAQGGSYTFEGSSFTPNSPVTLYQVSLLPGNSPDKKILSTNTDSSGNIFVGERSIDCDTFPVTHSYYAVDEATDRKSNQAKLDVTQSSECDGDSTAPPSRSPDPIKAELRPFDTNKNDLIDDPEFFEIIDAWVNSEIKDNAFFKAIDLWIGQRTISSLSLGTVTNQPLQLRTISLNSHNHATTFQVQGTGIALTQVDVYTLNGTRVFTQQTTGSNLRWNWTGSRGIPLANGVYLYRVTVEGPNGQIERSKIRKLMVMR